jgi:MoaA/NifB/PqqE/SkfB family radical SAM enzyme
MILPAPAGAGHRVRLMEKAIPIWNPAMTYTHVDLTKYIVVPVWWGCNNDCTLCMLLGIKGTLPLIGFDRYKKVIGDIVSHGRFENLILSGAEVTTFGELEEYIEFAASFRWFKKIQIQTNGRRLSDATYLARLIERGANEFFVSIHGIGDIHDAITQRQGSYRETMEGIRNLESLKVPFITNTVLTGGNYPQIPQLMSQLCRTETREIHLWNFFPMQSKDTKNLVVPLKEVLKLIPEILHAMKPSGKMLVLKAFPHCLPLEGPAVFDGRFPVTILPERFWREFSQSMFGPCVYRSGCKDSTCWGLSGAYTDKFGDERARLSPIT